MSSWEEEPTTQGRKKEKKGKKEKKRLSYLEVNPEEGGGTII